MPGRSDISPPAGALSDRSAVVEPAPPDAVQRLFLTSEEAYVYTRVDHPMPVRELLAASGLPEAKALALADSLVRKGALTVRAGRRAPAPEPAPEPDLPQTRWGSYVFNPVELAEPGVDLDEDERREILFLFYNRERLSHYRLLGIHPTASPENVTRAFADAVRRLHPDAFLRRRIGSYAQRLQALVPRFQEARDTLLDRRSREAYDRRAGTALTAEEREALALAEASRLHDEEIDGTRRRMLLRSRGFARLTRARQLAAEARAALAKGAATDAMRIAQQALGLDPRLEEAKDLKQRAQNMLAAQTLQTGREEAGGPASESVLQRVLALDPDNGGAHEDYARLTLARGDLREAQRHAQRAVDLGCPPAVSCLLLGEVLLRLGLKKNAARELEKAVEAGAGEHAKNLLLRC